LGAAATNDFLFHISFFAERNMAWMQGRSALHRAQAWEAANASQKMGYRGAAPVKNRWEKQNYFFLRNGAQGTCAPLTSFLALPAKLGKFASPAHQFFIVEQ